MTNGEVDQVETPANAEPEVLSAEQDQQTVTSDNGAPPIDVSGNWIGNVFGTNVGNATVKFEQVGETLTGEARFMDNTLGPTAYSINGVAGSQVNAELTPTIVPDGIQAGIVTVRLELATDGRLHGEWSSELGTGGVLTLERFFMPSQLDGGTPEQAPTTPARVYNAEHNVGAVRFGRDDLARLVDVVERDFTVGRAVVTYTPKGGSQRTEYASTLLADATQLGPLEAITVGVHEPEPSSINRGVSVELARDYDSRVRTYGSVESWVVGKAETVKAEVSRHERFLATGWKRWGLDFNGVIFLIALAYLPAGSAGIRLGYLFSALIILAFLKFIHARAIPMTVVQLGSIVPGFWSRVGAPILSWLLAIASAAAIKVLSDVLSGSPFIAQAIGWLSRFFGVETIPTE